MNRIKIYLFTIILTLTFGLAGVGSAAAQTNVKIVNTDREPVPTVAKGITMVENIDEPARQPFSGGGGGNSTNLTTGTVKVFMYKVPHGKRAVIEQVTVYTTSNSGNFPDFIQLFTLLKTGNADVHYLAPGNPFRKPSGYASATSTHQIRVYAEPDSQISIHIGGLNDSDITAFCTMSGYLIDVP